MYRRKLSSVVLYFLVSCLCLCFILPARATHIRSGQITVTRNNCNSLSFTITVTAYTNTGSPIRFSNGGVGELNFGDGSPIHHPPQQENSPVPGFGTEYGYVSYSVVHIFPGNGKFTISYFEHNRNAGILNMFNSVETPFYVATVINIDPLFGCDNSPRLLVPPIDKACSGAGWYHNPGAYDPDGDSISFEMTIPRQTVDQTVNDYRDPNVTEFYTNAGINYNTANSAGNGPPTFGIDPVTGTVTWDAPGAPGEYVIAFMIKEWRKISGQWVELGYVTRDMLIDVEDCINQQPQLTIPADLCVTAGDVINGNLFGTDPNHDDVKIEAFSEVFLIGNSPATFSPSPTVFQSTATTDATASFVWNTLCENIRSQDYQIIFKETDFPAPNTGSALVRFKTWNIRVAGPAPQGISVQSMPGGKAKLQWSNYTTCTNASSMQVWRRVNSYPFIPSACNTGMPGFLGFTKIADVPIGTTEYTDTNNGRGLAPGAKYCYRLVAAFGEPAGGESYASEESCFSMMATSPVITNVSVSETGSAGHTMIRWTPPFDADPTAFPGPYQYAVYRSDGFSGDDNLTQISAGKISDTIYVDAVNNKEHVYNYRVIAYSNGATIVGTSATASSVRLDLTPHNENIGLNWSADVPWSKLDVSYPWHLLYRGPENSTFSEMQLIDSVNVSVNDFQYADSGQWNSTKLSKTATYCYCVMTKGSYGNNRIVSPLENFSEINCARLGEITGDLVTASGTIYLYPNPSGDYILIKGIKTAAGNAQVIDLVGRATRIDLEKEDEDLLRADIRFLSNGMYIFQITDGNAVHQIKFIKQ